MKIMKEIYVTLNDKNNYRLNYMDWGNKNAKNTLVCVHGLTRNSRDFDYLAKELSTNHDYRVICPDMPGRGNSQYLPDYKLYNYENYCLAIVSLFDQLDLKNFDYLGTSMGALIAMHLSQIRTNLFNKLIFNDAGIFIPREALIRIARYISSYPKFKDLAHAKAHLKVKLANFGIILEEDWDYITMHSTRLNSDGDLILDYDLHISDGLSLLNDEDIKDLDYSLFWPKLTFKKMLIIHGINSDLLQQPTITKMIESKNNIRLLEFANTGHAPALMDKEQLKQVIDWLVE